MRFGRLGLVVNPVAGIGGAVGLKGSDGAAVQAHARALGGASSASRRAGLALSALAGLDIAIVTVAGSQGEELCLAEGIPHRVVAPLAATSDGRSTQAAVQHLVAAGAELILFAGGDGTARDVLCSAGRTPVLGIPAGVKMYSGVFAASPILAGRLAVAFLATPPALRRTAEVDVLDIDEDCLRRDQPALRLHGTAVVPASPAVPRAKATLPVDEDRQVEALCRYLADRLDPDCLHIVGPGRTTGQFMAACNLPKTLLGVDVMQGGRLLARDCGESRILELLDGRPARIVVGLLGAQGCLFGRGNQPIGSAVLRRVGVQHIVVLAGATKIASLPNGIFCDTGDADLDRALEGFIRVHTGPRRSTLLRLRAPTVTP